MNTRNVLLAMLMAVSLCILPQQTTFAARGLPGTTDFGQGIHLDLNSQYSPAIIEQASLSSLDWVAVDFSWKDAQPSAGGSIKWKTFDNLAQNASTRNVALFVSLTQPPAWVMTPQGPDPAATAQLVNELFNRSHGAAQAIEIFPAANTKTGWGQAPDAAAYAGLLIAVKTAVPQVVIVAGGLKPAHEAVQGEVVNDLAFLQALYASGGKNSIDVLSVRLDDTTGDPLSPPDGKNYQILRHYEEIRSVMLANDHATGLLWVTHLSTPSGKINNSDQVYQDKAKKDAWLAQASLQLRSQLYIGAVFYQPASSVSFSSSIDVAIRGNINNTPEMEILRTITTQSFTGEVYSTSGRSKTGEALFKKR